MDLFVTAAAGTEKPLKEELRELGLRGVKGDRGGVRLTGGLEAIATVCLASRIAIRVMVEVGGFDCPDEDALYRGIHRIEWERWLTPERSLAVQAVCRDSRLTHTQFIAQKTKDAVVDRQRSDAGVRSSVDRRGADVEIFVRVKKDRAGVFLDASGASLHLRGWRTEAGDAPLKETLAAAILRLSGWDRERPLVDPLCGSGTFPIEADLWASNLPAQPRQRRFGFERWADFDEAAREQLEAIKERLAGEVRSDAPSCVGRDASASVISIARSNATRAKSRARFEVGQLADLALDEPSHIVSNPPFGQRIDVDRRFWEQLSETLARMPQHTVSLLLPEDAPHDLVPGRYSRGHRLFNGRLPCRLVTWDPR